MTSVGLLDRVDRDDVRMVERGDGPRFALEALAALRIAADVARTAPSARPGVRASCPRRDTPRPCPAAEQPFDPIVSEAGADHVMSSNEAAREL